MKRQKKANPRAEGTLAGAVQVLAQAGYSRAAIVALVDAAIREARPPGDV